MSLPVIRNAEGLMHPEEFVFTAKNGRLSREQVREAAAKLNKKESAPKEKPSTKGSAADGTGSPEGSADASPASKEEAAA